MKKYSLLLTLLFVGMTLHLGSTNPYASFLITLKTGRTVYAGDYRIEGEHIILYFKSGILRISKNDVESMLEEKDQIKEEEREEVGENKKDTIKTHERNLPVLSHLRYC